MAVSLAEEVVLLAYNDEGIARGTGSELDLGIAGAFLLELALAGRIDIVNDRVTVIDRAATGDPLVDAALRRIAEDAKARKPRDWVSRLAKGARRPVLDRLVDAGVLRRERETVLWIFPRTVYPAPYGVEPPAETEARQRMRSAVTGTGRVDPRTGALCGLVSALRWERRAFTDLPTRTVRARLKEIRQQDWASEAVRKAVDGVQAAVAQAAAAQAAAVATATGG